MSSVNDQQVASLQLQRAQLVASLPSDADFEALLTAQENAQRANRAAAQDQVKTLDEQIAAGTAE